MDEPEDWRDTRAWETYWKRRTREPLFGLHYRAVGAGRGAILLRERLSIPLSRASSSPPPSILFAGNGTSPEPWLYAHWGVACIALDVSPSACAALERRRGDLKCIEWFYCQAMECERTERKPREGDLVSRPDMPTARKRVAEQHREGGAVVVTCADMFDYEPPTPVAAIVSRFSFQRFCDSDRDELARRFARWLVPGGMLLIEARFVPGGADHEQRHRIHSHLRTAGFFIHRAESERGELELSLARRRQHVSGTGETDWRAGWERLRELEIDEDRREEMHRAAGGRVAAIDLTSG
jgi:hypothetical protein